MIGVLPVAVVALNDQSKGSSMPEREAWDALAWLQIEIYIAFNSCHRRRPTLNIYILPGRCRGARA